MLDSAFGHPRGTLGRIGGALMARGNAETERRVVEIARPGAADTVLVLGPGPGVGLHAAAERAALVIGVDPAEAMLEAAGRRCAEQVQAGTVQLRTGTASETGLDAESVDLAVSVNNVQLWSDVPAGLAELARVLRPGGRLMISVHERWAPHGLAEAVSAAGFIESQSWRWEPEGRMASTAFQVRATRPFER
jgi:ubiquinone/menaquinone biosynthesis C-methylase UbiE